MLTGRGRWRPGGETVAALLPPVDLAGTTPRNDAVPALGEHTEQVLAQLGYDPARIAALRTEGAL